MKTDSSSSRSSVARVSLGGHEVPEQLAHDRHAVLSDALERRFGMLRQRAADAADFLVGRAGQQAALAIAPIPEPRHGEGDQRQRAALARDLREHLLDDPPRLRSDSRTSAPAGPAPAAGQRRSGGPSAVSSENSGARLSNSWQ